MHMTFNDRATSESAYGLRLRGGGGAWLPVSPRGGALGAETPVAMSPTARKRAPTEEDGEAPSAMSRATFRRNAM